MGCAQLTSKQWYEGNDFDQKKKEAKQTKEKLSNANILSPTIKGILATPKMAELKNSIAKANAILELTSTQENFSVSSSASAGGLSRSKDNTSEAFFGTLSASKLVYDGGLLKSKKDVDKNKIKIERIKYLTEIEKKLSKVLFAYYSLKNSKKIESLLINYLKFYNKQERNLKNAKETGLISNAEFLEIRSIKNDLMSKINTASFETKSNEIILKNNLETEFENALLELEKNFEPGKSIPRFKEGSLELEILKIKEKILYKEIDIEKQSRSFVSRLEGTATSPRTKDDQTSVFAGIRATFSIHDGGASKAKIRLLKKQIEGIKLQIDTLYKDKDALTTEYKSFDNFYKKQRATLETNYKISKKRKKDIEILIGRGNNRVGDLAKEIMKIAKLEMDIMSLEKRLVQKKLTVAYSSSITCSFLSVCDQIKNLVDIDE